MAVRVKRAGLAPTCDVVLLQRLTMRALQRRRRGRLGDEGRFPILAAWRGAGLVAGRSFLIFLLSFLHWYRCQPTPRTVRTTPQNYLTKRNCRCWNPPPHSFAIGSAIVIAIGF